MVLGQTQEREKQSESLAGESLKGLIPESWECIDCEINTAPGLSTRAEAEAAFAAGNESIIQRLNSRSEVYTVRERVWQAAGMEPHGGCLCIGCLEKRLNRRLRPKDFLRGQPLNSLPGTARLLQRRGRP